MSTIFPTALDSFINPSSMTPLDANLIDPAYRHSSQHDNINDSMVSVQAKLGVSLSSVETSLDYIANLLLMTQTQYPGSSRRVILGGPFPTNIIWYLDAGETIKLIEKKYTYNSVRNITKIELFLYNGTVLNVVVRTITDSITLSGPFEVSRTRIVS